MKKVFLLVLVMFGLTLFTGCSNVGKLDGVANISKEEIFNQEESTYFIYFHKLNCEDCEQTDPYVINYQRILDDYDNCAPKRKIYAVLIYGEEDKPGEDNYIFREYAGTDGQGTDGKFYVNGVSVWKDLYIGSTSSLISVSTNRDGVKLANYEAQGNANVTAKLETQLGNCYK
jgi:hypothetical protein